MGDVEQLKDKVRWLVSCAVSGDSLDAVTAEIIATVYDPAEILAAAANLDGVEPDYEAAAHAVYATRWGDHPSGENAAIFTWSQNIARAAVNAALVGRKVLPLPDKETPSE